MNNKSLLEILNPTLNSTILIYDVHASESGALAILNDLYNQIVNYEDKSVKWVFIVSTPLYEEKDNIIVRRYPWVKKNWFYRYYFNKITTRKILKEYKPDKVFSLQNEAINFFDKEQYVYLHLPFILTNHKFSLFKDGKTLWLYQNVISKMIFHSLRKANYTIVQTNWMKDALIKKANIQSDKIIIIQPDISSNKIKTYIDSQNNRNSFFYPATAFTYKNHFTLLRALNYVKQKGYNDWELLLTIKDNENAYTKKLYKYSSEKQLNVKFNGPISREDVFLNYTNSILIFPSYVESFGLPLLEAKMTGTIIIASDTPYSREILNGYNKAYFFNEMDYKELGNIILKISFS